MPNRSKRHHFVPQLMLSGFARDGQLTVVDRASGVSFPQAVERAAAENDYNSLELEDGSLTDAAERAIATMVEGPAGGTLARIRDGGWIETKAERAALARLVAFQFLRVPDMRAHMDAMADQMLKLDMATKGPTGMRDVLAARLGRLPTDEEVLAEWDLMKDFDEWKFELPREKQVQQSLEALDEFTPVLDRGYRWGVMRWKRKGLLTSDAPVVLLPPVGVPLGTPVGLYTAGQIHMGIGRQTALVLTNVADEAIRDGIQVPGSAAGARRLNLATMLSGQRWIYHHPDDTLDDLLGPDVETPPPRDVSFDDDHSRKLMAELSRMAEEYFHNPEAGHPFGRAFAEDADPDGERWTIDARPSFGGQAPEAPP